MKTKRLLVAALALILLGSAVIGPVGGVALAETNGTLQIGINTNVKSITISYGSTTNTYTSTAYVSIPVGTTINWSAETATGYEIEGGNSGSFEMTSYYKFAPSAVKITTYPLSISVGTNVTSISVTIDGTTTKYTSSTVVNVKQGASVSWTAVAPAGYNLSASSGSFTMTGAMSIAPTASIQTYTVAVTVNEGVDNIRVNGVNYSSSTTLTFNYGTSVSWTATAKTGYTLSQTSGSFTMTSSHKITPTATLNSYVLTVTLNTGVQSITVKYGSESKTFTESGSLSLVYGTSVSWSAVAKEGYTFIQTASGSFIMSAGHTISPNAQLKGYTLTVKVNTGVESVTVKYGSESKTFTESGSLTVYHGTSVSWTTALKSEYTITSSGTGSFTMTSAQTINPVATLNSYTLTVTVNENVQSVYVFYGYGEQTFTESGTLSIQYGCNVSWSATAKTGYKVIPSSDSLVMSGAQEISPIAEMITYKVLFFENGNVAKTVVVNYGEKVEAYIPDVVGYDFGGWYTNTGLTDAFDFSIEVKTNINLYAKLTEKSFTVSIASYLPTDAEPLFSWKLEWISGKELIGDATDYVIMRVAADGMSVTLTFKKAFSDGEMLLTCYASKDPNVFVTCSVKCGG